ncbi:hypothetical protein [Albimonas pacifica]|uniref:Uncharacterized protein n=1 Tax=Albimonas pacifica TaxID=1114924 RepID=A0A1I3JKH9_9RHOB|nr:hypothetical protein [Albimonas pacifica]SFI60630.1 hypothetical protein SAMN05216258_10842 [Albimonas pacifica]
MTRDHRYRTTDFPVACNCRSAGECSCHMWGDFDEVAALNAMVDAFAAEMKAKLEASWRRKGKGGWDSPNWHPDQILAALREHVDKGDPIDVANFAAFLWNRTPGRDGGPGE